MEYGMVFILDMYDFEECEAMHILTMPGDYIRMSRWTAEHSDLSGSETVGNLMRNYALAWFALRRRGELGKYALPGELDDAVLEGMSDRFSIFVNEMDDASLPLARGRGE